MKKSSDFKNISQHNTLENLELPEIVLPAHQKCLRETLLASAYAEKDKSLVLISKKTHKRVKRTQPRIWLFAASIALLLFSYGFYTVFLTMPPTVANMTLQINPIVNLSISERNTVVEAEGLDEQGELLLVGLDLKGRKMQEALKIITDALIKSGSLRPESQILVALIPIEDKMTATDIELLAQTVRNALTGYLLEQNLLLDVKVVPLSNNLSDVILNAGLMPVYYVDLVEAIGSEMAAKILNLETELGIDPELFKGNLDAITSSVIDMVEAQITDDNIVIALKAAMTANPELTMLPAIIDALIEFIEEGLSFEDALDKIQSAIQTDISLEALDELFDPSEGDEHYEPEDEETDEPEEIQDNDEPETDEPIELEQPQTENEQGSDDLEPNDPTGKEQPTDEEEAGSDEIQDDNDQEVEDPADSEQPSDENEEGSTGTQDNNDQETENPADSDV